MSAADYSDARPGGVALRAAGITAVGRYLGIPGDPRVLEAAEYADLRAHGIDVWLNREGAATSMLGGYSTGVYHAQTAAANLARLGITLDSVIVYASADFDVQDSQFPTLDAYMDGFISVLGESGKAIYGGLHIINHFRANGKAKWFWKSAASSWDHGETGFVHIQQTTLPSLAGTDNNILHADVYGQIGAGVAGGGAQPFDPKTPQEADMPIFTDTDKTIYWPNGWYSSYDPGVYQALKAYFTNSGQVIDGTAGTVSREVWAATDGLIAREANVDAKAVLAAQVQSLVPAVASAVVTALPPQVAPQLTDAQLQAIAQSVTTAVTSTGLSIPQAQVDAIAAASASAVRAAFKTDPLS